MKGFDMKQIWRFPFTINDIVKIEMPIAARILSCQTKGRSPQLWALVDTTAKTETRTFRVYATGHSIKTIETLEYINTFQIPELGLVFHIFEQL